MSNWKVGPAGQLYDPKTGAYVGQLDANGVERMVVSATPSDKGPVMSSGDAPMGVIPVTLAALKTTALSNSVVYQVVDLPGQPLFASNGAKWVQISPDPLYDNGNPYIPFGLITAELTTRSGIAFSEPGIATYGTICSKLINFSGGFNLAAADFGLGAFPAGATAMEIWSPSGSAIAWVPATTGNLVLDGSNNATDANLLVPAVSAGVRPPRVIIPFGGSITASTPRFAAKAPGAGVYLNARLIGIPQKYQHAGGVNSDLITGAGASIQFNYGNTAVFPAGTDAVLIQINGGAGTTFSTDGAAPSATRGEWIAPGEMRLIDFTDTGFSLSQLRLYLTAGQFARALALKRAY